VVEFDFEHLERMAREEGPEDQLLARLGEATENALRAGAELIVPVEAVNPPLPLPRLADVQALISKLPEAGARGTPGGLDGAVTTGGHDIEPVRYKAAAEVEGRYDPARDAVGSETIDRTVQDRTPPLGICRGAQLLTVRLGGTLFQDLRSRRRKASNRRSLLPLKTLCVEEHTLLARLLGRAPIAINSLHHQSIDRLGAGLRVPGRNLDRTVPAIESPQCRCLFGAQWHPGFLICIPRQHRRFRKRALAAKEYAARRDGRA
jgi:putative glutamine amidotransferase